MIPRFASPSVCVIDDEEEDYRPILHALMKLGLGCVHVRGTSAYPLPPQPFDALRVVFIDLHLSGNVGKAAASHTANVVRKVVSPSSGPVLLVIWSKYAADPAGDASIPPEDQPTEADFFKEALLFSEPRFKSRVFFVEMAKPKLPDRPAEDEWIETLRGEIENILTQLGAFDLLWTWEALVRSVGIEVSETLTKLAESNANEGEPLGDKLEVMLKRLAQQQGGPDCSPETALRHLLTVLSQLGLDVLETASSDASLGVHAEWLAEELGEEGKRKYPSAKLNAVLLTSSATPSSAALMPGTVYDVLDNVAMATTTGFSVERLQRDCFGADPEKSAAFSDFKSRTKPVFLEITPVCDFHQDHRRAAMLLAGLACPVELLKKANSKDACKTTPVFEDRYATPPQDLGFVFCGRYRFTTSHEQRPTWLRPRLRLREIVATDIRNWHASQAARVGYLSF